MKDQSRIARRSVISDEFALPEAAVERAYNRDPLLPKFEDWRTGGI